MVVAAEQSGSVVRPVPFRQSACVRPSHESGGETLLGTSTASPSQLKSRPGLVAVGPHPAMPDEPAVCPGKALSGVTVVAPEESHSKNRSQQSRPAFAIPGVLLASTYGISTSTPRQPATKTNGGGGFVARVPQTFLTGNPPTDSSEPKPSPSGSAYQAVHVLLSHKLACAGQSSPSRSLASPRTPTLNATPGPPFRVNVALRVPGAWGEKLMVNEQLAPGCKTMFRQLPVTGNSLLPLRARGLVALPPTF